MSDWKEVTIGDICTVKRGASPRPIQNFMCKDGMPWVKIADATRSNSRYINSTEEYITEAGVPKSRIVTPGTLIVSNSATPGLPKIMDITGCVHDGWLIIDDFNGVLKEYMYYKFIDIRRVLSNQANGSVFMNLKTDIVKNFPINVPSIDEQKRIVAYLENIDAKIECNQKICDNLEQQAQALFKNWFIDFAPFKDGKFVESELGMIPEGWRVYRFPDFISPSSDKVREEGIPEYSVTNTGIHPRDEKFRKNLSKTSSTNKLLRKNDLVFGMSREILNWGVMEDEKGGVSPAYQIYRVDQSKVDSIYLKEYISHKINYFRDLIKASTREGQSLDKGALFNKLIYIPPKSILSGFFSIWNVLKVEITTLQQENLRLSTLRDTLLPKLMSGQIKV